MEMRMNECVLLDLFFVHQAVCGFDFNVSSQPDHLNRQFAKQPLIHSFIHIAQQLLQLVPLKNSNNIKCCCYKHNNCLGGSWQCCCHQTTILAGAGDRLDRQVLSLFVCLLALAFANVLCVLPMTTKIIIIIAIPITVEIMPLQNRPLFVDEIKAVIHPLTMLSSVV